MSNQVASTSTQNIVPVQAEFDTSGNCLGLIGPGGAFFSPPLTSDAINGATINSSSIGATTPSTGNFTQISLNGGLIQSSTLPTLGTGFGTGATITATSTASFSITVGTGTVTGGVINFPAAPNGWIVQGYDITAASTVYFQQTAFTTTSATVAAFSMTTGLSTTLTSGNVLIFTATAF